MRVSSRTGFEEVLCDYERLIRLDERMDVLFDCDMAGEIEIKNFYENVAILVEKYIPDYDIGDRYPDKSYEKALILYSVLQNYLKDKIRNF